MEEKDNEMLENEASVEETIVSDAEVKETSDAAEAEENENIIEENKEESKDAVYAFKWNYSEQFEHDKRPSSKRPVTRGAVTYGLIMLTVFVLAFAVLVASISLGKAAPNNAISEELSVVQIIEKGMPSSVSILAAMDDGTSVSSGSGFVVNDYGYIVTNYHVIEGSSQIVITDCNGKQYSADMINYNAELDLALLYAENSFIAAATLADSNNLKLGETVVAIGSPTGSGTSLSVSNGIVSALDRQTSSPVGMIQTNAPLNPGNSGGPLFDSNGNVVGIVTSKLAYTTDATGEKIPLDGIAYAIPINSAKAYIEMWIGKDLQKPMLGISAVPVEKGKVYFYDGVAGIIYNYAEVDGVKYKINSAGTALPLSQAELESKSNFIIDSKATGIYVIKVTKGLGAYGKLQAGDIVVALGGREVSNVVDAREVFDSLSAGDTVNVRFYRNGKLTSSSMTLKTKGDMLAADRNS